MKLAPALIQWYEVNKRALPWRNTSDPYFIWLSEVLLQQTRVAQAIPYYTRFTETFPDIFSLARASENEVLRLWQGLGYYSRGRNLQVAARQVVEQYQGKFPDNFNALLSLKGVGPYTAAAVASIAFNEPVAVLDGNVFRVIARIFGIETDINSGKGMKEFAKLAKDLLPESNFSTYNQAIMEFGALQCTPLKPKCHECPFANFCVANINGIQNLLPVKINKLKKKNRHFHYLVFLKNNHLLLRKRTQKDIWTGLFEFYLVEKDQHCEFLKIMEEEQLSTDDFSSYVESKVYKHILTHQNIYAKALFLEVRNDNVWEYLIKRYHLTSYNKQEVEELPKPVLISKILDTLAF